MDRRARHWLTRRSGQRGRGFGHFNDGTDLGKINRLVLADGIGNKIAQQAGSAARAMVGMVIDDSIEFLAQGTAVTSVPRLGAAGFRLVTSDPCPHVGVDGPRTASMCQNEVVKDLKRRRPSVEQIIQIGMDTSKHVFQLHGVNAAEEPVLRKKLRRKEMIAFFEKVTPTVIAIEACGASHHWARLLQSFGHEVKLLPPHFVKIP